MKKLLSILAVVSLILTACNMNELVDVNRSADLINFTVTNGGMTKAVDVTTANLAAFEVTAFNHGTETSPYINAVSYTGGSGTFASATPYYWPEGNLDFYAWSVGAAEGQVSKTNFKTFVVTPSATPASQVDLIFAGKTNIGKGNSTDGAIALNFRHAESKIVVKVKNTAPNLKFVISDWRLGFIDDAGTFTYSGQGAQYDGSTDGNNSAQLAASMWSGNTDAAASKMYTNTLASNVNIAANASETLLDGEMIVIPQSVTAASAHASAAENALVNGSYIGLKLMILNRENDSVIYSDGNNTAWAIWPADFNFEPGKKYTFTVDLCGGGYYETNHDANTDLDPILEGAVISFASVTVDEFAAQESIPVPDNRVDGPFDVIANDDKFVGETLTIYFEYAFPDATGTISYTIFNESLGYSYSGEANVTNGSADFDISELPVGFYSVWVSYSGDSNYKPGLGYNSFFINPRYVDLGLRDGSGNKIVFATTNIGAVHPEDYGVYFAWGETSKRYTSIDWEHPNEYGECPIVGGTFEGSNTPFWNGSAWTKYNTTDNKLTLDADDDVAMQMWWLDETRWRMPDKTDLEFLLNSTYCTVAHTADYNSTGVAGFVVTGKGDYAGNSIFLPAAGVCIDALAGGTGIDGNGCYWSRSLSTPDCVYCLALYEDVNDSEIALSSRYAGLSVRPVLVIPE